MGEFSGPELKFKFRYLDESRIEVVASDVINHHSIIVSWGSHKREFTGNTETVRNAIKEWVDSTLQLRKGQRDAISKIVMAPKQYIPDAFEDINEHTAEFESLRNTEKEAIIKSRLGQGIFRKRLIEKWGSCSVTGLTNPVLLKASHIKPWRDSSNDERLDPYNGLLLAPNFDTLFDSGLVTFEDQGSIKIALQLTKQDRKLLHVNDELCLRRVFPENKKYLRHHRKNIFNRNDIMP